MTDKNRTITGAKWEIKPSDFDRVPETPLREQLAAFEHQQWAHWTRHMLDTLQEVIGLGFYEARDNGIDLSKTKEALDRWRRQINTVYEDLTEDEKDADRVWADEVLAIVGQSTGVLPEVLWRNRLEEQRATDRVADSIEAAEDDRILKDLLPRTPEGYVNNCLLRATGAEFDPEHGACPMCNGLCPDRERLEAEGLVPANEEG